jgi:lipopolysaccharide export system permease protein
VRRLDRMLLASFVPVFVVATMFFVLLMQLIDVFSSVWRYIAHAVPLVEIGAIALLYTPKCVAYSLPIAFLFAVSFTLGQLYARGELAAILGSGVSLYRLVAPFLALGVLLSAASFFFEDAIVIPTFRQRNAAWSAVVKAVTSLSQANVTVASPDQREIYQADYYNDAQSRLTGLTVIVRAGDLGFERRLDAAWAEWTADRWVLHDCRVFTWDPTARALTDDARETIADPTFDEPPETFRRLTRNVEEMGFREARDYVALLRRAGFSSAAALTDLYRKLSFACTPLIVALIASSLGSAFRKNILLMSLLAALVVSVLFYVSQMVTGILSKNGVISPLAGAWIPFTLFLLLGVGLFRTART